MAFFSKAGSIFKQTVGKHINSEICGSNPSIFQIIRSMSSSKLFVGGISFGTDDTSLREAFIKYGEVVEARVIIDRESGRSRGFGFVTYTSGEEASAAIQALDGQEIHGRRVRVNYANDRAPPRGGGFGGGGYGGGGGGYGGGGYGGGGDNYGGGGNYSSYESGGGGYGGNNYGREGSGGNYGGGSQNFGVAGGGGGGGGGGGDDYGSGDAGVNSSFTSSGFGGNTRLGESGDQIDLSGDFGQDKDDDDEPGDYANRRA